MDGWFLLESIALSWTANVPPRPFSPHQHRLGSGSEGWTGSGREQAKQKRAMRDSPSPTVQDPGRCSRKWSTAGRAGSVWGLWARPSASRSWPTASSLRRDRSPSCSGATAWLATTPFSHSPSLTAMTQALASLLNARCVFDSSMRLLQTRRRDGNVLCLVQCLPNSDHSESAESALAKSV